MSQCLFAGTRIHDPYTFRPVGLYRPTGSSTCQVAGSNNARWGFGFPTCRDCPQRQVPYVALLMALRVQLIERRRTPICGYV